MLVYFLVLFCVDKSNAMVGGDQGYVMTTQGPVIGKLETGGVYAFYNIPYATAPTGENKFKAPLPPPSWTDPFYAVDKGVICRQAEVEHHKVLKTKNMTENCLIANLYVPNTARKNLPVVLYIHGGGFQIGYGDRRKAKGLMKRKRIIVVTFNYRLGIVGFLCLGTHDIPGNAGMKDIVAMLHWLNKNIGAFGGNPDDITVSGYSTGAAAADLLILSKLTKGLFHKVIIESGSGIAPYAIQPDPFGNALRHARFLNYTGENDIYALERFYKSLEAEELSADAFLARKDSSFVFVPCVENRIARGAFLHDTPINILNSGHFTKLPMLYGLTNMEGLMRLPLFKSWAPDMNKKFEDFLPPDLQFKSHYEKREVARQIKEFYFRDKPIDSNTIIEYINYFTDVMFTSPALRSVTLNVGNGNDEMYLYYYAFADESQPFVPFTVIRGANHCAQSIIILDDLEPKNNSEEYTTMRKVIRELWNNFIITGNPVPENSSLPLSWPPTSADRSPFLTLGQSVEVSHRLLEERSQFWDFIYEKHYKQPVPPPKFPPEISVQRLSPFYKHKETRTRFPNPFAFGVRL